MMQRINAVLPVVLTQAAKQHGALTLVQRRWRALVGRALAAHSRPVSLRRGRLIVHVDCPGDSYTLSFQRTTLLRRLKQHAKGDIEELILRPGQVKRPSRGAWAGGVRRKDSRSIRSRT